MSSSGFRPHGLIRTQIEQALYNRAHIANVYTGIADPKEYETSALMMFILYSHLFTAQENFVVSAEQPPEQTTKKRCDIVVRYLESGGQRIRVLCFAECKRARTSQKFSLHALEEQARGYCEEYLKSEPDTPWVYAATMAGAHVRLWTVKRHVKGMVPFTGLPTEGDWNEYKDVGDDTAGRELEICFRRMKEWPPEPHAVQSADTYGTSGNQASTTSYAASGPAYQVSTSAYPGPAASYQASAAGYPTSQYAATPPQQEMSSSSGKSGQMDQSMGDAELLYRVRVRTRTHKFGKDEWIFTNKKGKVVTTTRDQWKKTTDQGQVAWRYHDYICFDP